MTYARNFILIFFFSIAILLAGCKAKTVGRTTSMQNIKSIPIIAGITSKEVIKALILSADPFNKVKKRRRGPMMKSYEDGRWSREDSTDNFVVLAYSLGQHFVRVKFEIIGQEIVPIVLSSEYLMMTQDRIHKSAVVWINRHSVTIRESMWNIKHSKEKVSG